MYSVPRGLAKQGKHREAVAAYEELLHEFPNDPTALLDLAQLYDGKLRDHQRAVEYYTQVENAVPAVRTVLFAINRKAS